MSSSRAFLARWIGACAAAAALGASLGYVSVAPGPPRLLADALLMGATQALALGSAAKRLPWIVVTTAALGLGLIAGVIVVLGIGLPLGPLERSYPDLYVAIVYGLGAAGGGLVASAAQAPVLRGVHRAGPWLIGNAVGAPFVLPALALSWFAPENLTVGAPLWLIGLAGGLVYGVASGVGFIRATSPRTS